MPITFDEFTLTMRTDVAVGGRLPIPREAPRHPCQMHRSPKATRIECALCLQARPLCDSHIIPPFLFESFCDEKERLFVLSTKHQPQIEQKGFRDWLLCKECESRRSAWESYAARLFSGAHATICLIGVPHFWRFRAKLPTRPSARADLILIFHPNWWGQPPAILEGWIDRVFRLNTAYAYPPGVGFEGAPVGRLRARHAIVINTSNTPAGREAKVFGDPLETLWKTCVFGLCGVDSVIAHVCACIDEHRSAARHMAFGSNSAR